MIFGKFKGQVIEEPDVSILPSSHICQKSYELLTELNIISLNCSKSKPLFLLTDQIGLKALSNLTTY